MRAIEDMFNDTYNSIQNIEKDIKDLPRPFGEEIGAKIQLVELRLSLLDLRLREKGV